MYIDLWKKTANDLNLTYAFDKVDKWNNLFLKAEMGNADIILHRVVKQDIERYNLSK